MDFTYYTLYEELLKEPHLVIAGTTGSGKSVMLNSLIYTAIIEGSAFYFIDLKRVELSRYKRVLTSLGYASEPSEVIPILDRAIGRMEGRYKAMKGLETDAPDVYVVIDELADCLTIKGVLDRLVKIGRLGRAAHIHLLCATQDPSKKTLSAQLLQNITTRVALRCFSPVESRQVIGINGAELLPRYGRGLLRDANGVRGIEIPLTPESDINGLVSSVSCGFLKKLFIALSL